MQKLFEVLKKCPLFFDIKEEDLQSLLTCLGAKESSYKKGQFIFNEGEPAQYLAVVISGSVRVIRDDYYGNRSLVAHIGQAEVFGESFACAGITSLPISVMAEEDCSCLLIDCKRITSTCNNSCEFHNRMIFNLLRLVANKNILFHQKLEVISKRSTREKLMTYLTNEAQLQSSNDITIPYDRQSLADYLGVDRSGLSTEIGKLCKEGIIDCHKNHFKLIN